jgi:hypothetical protein
MRRKGDGHDRTDRSANYWDWELVGIWGRLWELGTILINPIGGVFTPKVFMHESGRQGAGFVFIVSYLLARPYQKRPPIPRRAPSTLAGQLNAATAQERAAVETTPARPLIA